MNRREAKSTNAAEVYFCSRSCRRLDWHIRLSLCVQTPAQVFSWPRSQRCAAQPWKEKQGQRLWAECVGSPVSMPPLCLQRRWLKTPRDSEVRRVVTSCDCYNKYKTEWTTHHSALWAFSCSCCVIHLLWGNNECANTGAVTFSTFCLLLLRQFSPFVLGNVRNLPPLVPERSKAFPALSLMCTHRSEATSQTVSGTAAESQNQSRANFQEEGGIITNKKIICSVWHFTNEGRDEDGWQPSTHPHMQTGMAAGLHAPGRGLAREADSPLGGWRFYSPLCQPGS